MTTCGVKRSSVSINSFGALITQRTGAKGASINYVDKGLSIFWPLLPSLTFDNCTYLVLLTFGWPLTTLPFLVNVVYGCPQPWLRFNDFPQGRITITIAVYIHYSGFKQGETSSIFCLECLVWSETKPFLPWYPYWSFF